MSGRRAGEYAVANATRQNPANTATLVSAMQWSGEVVIDECRRIRATIKVKTQTGWNVRTCPTGTSEDEDETPSLDKTIPSRSNQGTLHHSSVRLAPLSLVDVTVPYLDTFFLTYPSCQNLMLCHWHEKDTTAREEISRYVNVKKSLAVKDTRRLPTSADKRGNIRREEPLPGLPVNWAGLPTSVASRDKCMHLLTQHSTEISCSTDIPLLRSSNTVQCGWYQAVSQ